MNSTVIPELPEHVFASGASRFESRDPDETWVHMRNVFSPHRLTVVGDAQHFAAKVQARKLGGLTLSTLSFGAEVTLDQEPSRDFLLVSTQISGHANIQVADRQYSGGRGLVMVDTPHQPVRKHFSADSRRIHLRFDTRRVEAACADLLGRKLDRPLHFSPCLPIDSAAHGHWMAMLHLLSSYVDQPAACGERQLASMMTHLEEAALLLLLNEHDHNYRDALLAPAPVVAPKVVARAEEFMAQHMGEDLTLAAIAAAVNVSVRSLSAAFRRYRQTSVMEALQERRLQSVRAALQQGQGTVAEVACRYGFNHQGRFAELYRRRYGELPGATLKQSAR